MYYKTLVQKIIKQNYKLFQNDITIVLKRYKRPGNLLQQPSPEQLTKLMCHLVLPRSTCQAQIYLPIIL